MKQKTLSHISAYLRCPICKSPLQTVGEQWHCTKAQHVFPLVDDIPVLLNEENSVFRVVEFTNKQDTFFPSQSGAKKALQSVLPSLSNNILARRNYARLAQMVRAIPHATVLVVGGGIIGNGMEVLFDIPNIQIVETDVAFGPRTQLVCDAHDLPFTDETFDVVIVQAVMEHVADPWRVSQECKRVLKPNGIIYAETPFMQQVHGGRYDFTRFTHLGHRRLFNWSTEVASGPTCGTGMALAWSYEYFLLSLTNSRALQRIVRVVARCTAFWLKYIDYLTIHTKGSYDAASGYYYIGTKSSKALKDSEIIGFFRGRS
jgi:SAM-dependent methyltransferase